MGFFDTYVSNTLIGNGNQSYFTPLDTQKTYVARAYFKLFACGTFPYALLFSNTIDSTYEDGGYSHKNLVLDEWLLSNVQVGVCKTCDMEYAQEPEQFFPLTFEKKAQKQVHAGELFYSDPVTLTIEEGNYLCVQLSFSGRQIPCHIENLCPRFVQEGKTFEPSKHVPLPCMIGCARQVTQKIGYLGDSITQGIGTLPNSYQHWNAQLSDLLGKEHAYWNLGIGYGRAEDAASDGAWLYKAKKMQTLIVCFGVNDLMQGKKVDQIKTDLYTLVKTLKACHIQVILQTVPPFDYPAEIEQKWLDVNCYIQTELANFVDGVFDVVPYLLKENTLSGAQYGGHPDAVGCKIWAQALYQFLMKNHFI